MNRNREAKSTLTAWPALLLLLLLIVPATASANHFELARIARQLDLVSSQLAYELRYNGGYSSVRSRANSLSKEAAQLVYKVERNRSNSSLRAQFRDVNRRYERLEEAFLRANRNYFDAYIYQEFTVLSTLFSNLSSEFYYAVYEQPRVRQPYYNSSRAYSYSPYSSRSYSTRNYLPGLSIRNDRNSRNLRNSRNIRNDRNDRNVGNDRNSRDNRSPRTGASRNTPPTVVNRQQGIPPVFRGDRGIAEAGRSRNQAGRGSRQAERPDNSSQRSPVLERQNRQNNDRARASSPPSNRSDRAASSSSRSERRARQSGSTDRSYRRVR